MKHTLAVATGLALIGLLGVAEAHFRLDSPDSVNVLSSLGDPQKTAPCGGAGTASNKVTAVQSGTMLSITIEETVFHPGHYRVSVAQDEAGLPAAPTVTSAQCNGLTPQANPSLPVLADGLLAHTAAFSGPQTMQVPIPAGMTCTGCVVQVLEYMASHAQPCFYYHCAKVDISPNAPPPPDAGVPGDDGGGTPTDPGSGCCSASPRSAATGLLGALVVGLALGLRRRRPRR